LIFLKKAARAVHRRGKGLERTAQEERVELGEGLSAGAVLARCLSDENRIRIILFLANGKESVSRIVEQLQLSQPLVSHHLKELRRCLLVKIERNGPFIYYELADRGILAILKDLAALGKNLLATRKTF
jgi:DNA-binding transcriptional ArsR family regulator